MVELETITQYVVVGRKHDFWARDEVGFPDLDGCTFIMRQPASQTRVWLDEMLARHGVTPRINAEFDNVESIKRTVAVGNGLTILPRYAIHDEETFGTFTRALPHRRPAAAHAETGMGSATASEPCCALAAGGVGAVLSRDFQRAGV